MSAPTSNRTGDLTTTKVAVQLTPVKSSNITKLGWHDGALHVEFSNGGLFSYAGVPLHEYEALMKAPSIGAHFAKHVRNKYKGTKL